MRALNPEYRARKNTNQAKYRLNPEYREREKLYYREHSRKKRQQDADYQKRKAEREQKHQQQQIRKERKKFIKEEIRWFYRYWRLQPTQLEEQRKKCRERARIYARKNRQILNEKQKYRHRTDPAYRLRRNLRTGLRNALKLGKKSVRTMEIVGCSVEWLLNYLQMNLPKGYIMEDFLSGKLVIDHVMPLASFNQSDMNHVRLAWNWQNLRLIPGKQNRAKHAKIIHHQFHLPISFDTPVCDHSKNGRLLKNPVSADLFRRFCLKKSNFI